MLKIKSKNRCMMLTANMLASALPKIERSNRSSDNSWLGLVNTSDERKVRTFLAHLRGIRRRRRPLAGHVL
jgi:hypothetical protein